MKFYSYEISLSNLTNGIPGEAVNWGVRKADTFAIHESSLLDRGQADTPAKAIAEIIGCLVDDLERSST